MLSGLLTIATGAQVLPESILVWTMHLYFQQTPGDPLFAFDL